MYKLVSCFVRKGIVYRPMWAKDTNGLFHSIEPVAVVPAEDTEGLRRAFRDAMAFGHPVVPAIPWQEREKQPFVVLKYAGVKSFSTFQRDTFGLHLSDKDGIYKVVVERRRRRRQGWEPDPDQTFILSPGSTLDDAIERAIQLIQEKSRAQTAGT
jgi:hypothetical protein